MLTFTEDYFKTETREGFTINELMKRAWAAQLEVLDKIIEICKKYDLTYYAFGGTLLGAVRHKGYIPWDDDLDIAMKRDDYIKFLEVVKAELPEGYCILNAYEEDEYEEVFTRITNRRVIDFSDKHMEANYNCPLIVGVDVFPLYYIPRDKNQAEIQKSILGLIGTLNGMLAQAKGQKSGELNQEIAEVLVELQKITGYEFTADKPIRTQLEIVYDQICRIYEEYESDAVTQFPVYMMCGYALKKDLWGEGLLLPFENLKINAPVEYEEVLRVTFGDYMVPKRNTAMHDYPYYKSMLYDLGRYIEKKDCGWKQQKGTQLPTDWQEKIRGKKVILYHTSADALMCHGECVVEKLRYVLDTFRNESGVILWWFPCILDNPDMSFIQQMSPQLVQEYHQVLDEYRQMDWGICDETGDMRRAVDVADAYYGDESELMQLFKENGKCIMIQDYEIV